MKLNWKVRLKNKNFWLTFVPALLLTIQGILSAAGIDWQPETLSNQLIAIVNSVFAVLAALGIVTDPTTKGLSDTDTVMAYDCPRCEQETSEDEEKKVK